VFLFFGGGGIKIGRTRSLATGKVLNSLFLHTKNISEIFVDIVSYCDNTVGIKIANNICFSQSL
jgi:hypothetical protein